MVAIAVCGVVLAFAGATHAQQGGTPEEVQAAKLKQARESKRIDKFSRPKKGKIAPPSQLKNVDPDADQPIIKVDNMVHDFGATWIGPKLEHTFKITNEGKDHPTHCDGVMPVTPP